MRSLTILSSLLVISLMIAPSVDARIYTTAARGEAGQMYASGYFDFGTWEFEVDTPYGDYDFEVDIMEFAGQLHYFIAPELEVWGQFGIINADPEGGDSETGFGLGGGAKYNIFTVENGPDLAPFGTIIYADIDETSIIELTGGGIASMTFEQMITPYGGLALRYERWEAEGYDDSEIDIMLFGGIDFVLNEKFKAMGELKISDDVVIGIGGSFAINGVFGGGSVEPILPGQ